MELDEECEFPEVGDCDVNCRLYICGNNMREPNEECDNDLTKANGDGCDEFCNQERGYNC